MPQNVLQIFNTADESAGLIIEQPYYKWLQNNVGKGDVHRIHTKLKYLKSLGFELDSMRITPELLQILNAIEWYYFYLTKNT